MANIVLFGILTAMAIPSLICYLYIFFELFRKGILRNQIRTHTIFVVSLCNFLQVTTELPTILFYLQNGIAPNQSNFFCKFWACQDYSFNVMILMLMAYLAIERYLLVLHNPFFLRHLIILHYIPIIYCIIYPIGLYIYLIFFYPCENNFIYTMITCGGPCYFYEPAISTFDQFADLVLPVTISTVASLALLTRVIYQKHQMQQHRMWKKNRRLLIQLLYIVVFYNILWLPMVTVSTIMLFSPVIQPFLVELSINILPMGIYVVILLCPFVSLMGLPELWPRRNRRISIRTGTNTHLQPSLPQRFM